LEPQPLRIEVQGRDASAGRFPVFAAPHLEPGGRRHLQRRLGPRVGHFATLFGRFYSSGHDAPPSKLKTLPSCKIEQNSRPSFFFRNRSWRLTTAATFSEIVATTPRSDFGGSRGEAEGRCGGAPPRKFPVIGGITPVPPNLRYLVPARTPCWRECSKLFKPQTQGGKQPMAKTATMLRPLGDRILIKPLEQEETTR